MGRKNLDGDAAVQTGIARTVDFAHAARTDGSDDFIGAESASGRQVHVGANYNATTRQNLQDMSDRALDTNAVAFLLLWPRHDEADGDPHALECNRAQVELSRLVRSEV